MKNKKLIWITVLLAIVSIFVIFFTQKETAKTTLNISDFGKEKAFAIAETYLTERGIDFGGYDIAYNLRTNRELDAFLKKNFSNEEIRILLENDKTPEIFYSVRFLKNLEKKEYVVKIDPASERVLGFSKNEEETKKEDVLSKEDAKKLSFDFLTSAGYDIATLEDYDYSEKKFPGRTESVFVFKITGTGATTSYGDFFKKVSVRSSGENIYSFNESYFTPETFKTELSKTKAYGVLFTILSLLVSLFMIISAFVIFFKKARKENIRWKLFFGVSSLLFTFLLIDFFNGLNILKMFSDPIVDFKVGFIIALLISIIIAIAVTSIVYVTGSAGDYYNNQKKENNFFSNIKTGLSSKETRLSVFVGYMLAIISISATSLIYYIGEKYFGVWAFGDSQMFMIFTTTIPAFFVFMNLALLPAISEEFLYRFFGIRFFEKLTKSLAFGIVLSSVIWAASHMAYDVFPFYFRGIELLIMGSLLGFYFHKFGIITTITSHYVYNASLALFASYFIASSGTFWSILFVVLVPGVLVFVGAVAERVSSK